MWSRAQPRARDLRGPSVAALALGPAMQQQPGPSAEADAEILTRMLHADGFDGPLEPWDWRFYSEKRRKIEHDLDEAELAEGAGVDVVAVRLSI